MGEWMDYGDYYWGLYRAYYKDPFPRSLLSTRQKNVLRGPGAEDDARPRRLLRLGQISRQLELGSWFRGGWGWDSRSGFFHVSGLMALFNPLEGCSLE